MSHIGKYRQREGGQPSGTLYLNYNRRVMNSESYELSSTTIIITTKKSKCVNTVSCKSSLFMYFPHFSPAYLSASSNRFIHMTFSVCHLNTAPETKAIRALQGYFYRKTTNISINGVPIHQIPTLCSCVSVL